MAIFLLPVFLFIAFLIVFNSQRLPHNEEYSLVSTSASAPASTEEITHGNIHKKQIIFTFDGGSNSASADLILQTLAKHRVKGTFFLTGEFILAHPDLARQMIREGHEIFNHTYDHPHLTEISDIDIIHELTKMDDVALSITGSSTKPYFRPPYGDHDIRVRNVAAGAGYQSIYWTVDAKDWEQSDGKSAQEVEDRILSSLSPGNIYLMHIGDTITGEILDRVFSDIEAEGYKLVSLTQGLI
jgi:peptidoglycan/xylan/chitin deacetylase (PgdA/CDA1 family)